MPSEIGDLTKGFAMRSTVPTLDDVRNGPPMVNVQPSAALIGISKSHAYELIQRGEFPCRVVKVGRRYRVPRTALLALLEGEPTRESA